MIGRLEGERFNVITLKWWAGRARCRASWSATACPARSRRSRRSSGGSGRRWGWSRSNRRRPAIRSATCGPGGARRRRLDAGDTFVYCHLKSIDAAGHTKDPRNKQATIEPLDTALGDLPVDRAIVCMTGDHATPASPEVIHRATRYRCSCPGPACVPISWSVRGARLRGRDPRPGPSAGPDAGAAQRCRPAAVPRLPADPVQRRRRYPALVEPYSEHLRNVHVEASGRSAAATPARALPARFLRSRCRRDGLADRRHRRYRPAYRLRPRLPPLARCERDTPSGARLPRVHRVREPVVGGDHDCGSPCWSRSRPGTPALPRWAHGSRCRSSSARSPRPRSAYLTVISDLRWPVVALTSCSRWSCSPGPW